MNMLTALCLSTLLLDLYPALPKDLIVATATHVNMMRCARIRHRRSNAALSHFSFLFTLSYTYYTYKKNGNCDEDADKGPVNRLSRWMYDPATKTIDPDSEVVFFETAPLAMRYHNSGKIEFGKDGLLYVTCGDGGTRDDGQEIDSLFATMIRLTDTGEIPPTNPFYDDPDGVRCNATGKVSNKKCQEIYAAGLRNPW